MSLAKTVLLSLAIGLFTSIFSLCAKMASYNMNNTMIIFFTFAISFLYIVANMVIAKFRNKRFPYKTNHLYLHIFRACTSFLTMSSLYYALKFIPLVDATTLLMTRAIFIPILIFLIFQKGFYIPQISATIIGFIGITLVLKPNAEVFESKGIFALLAGLSAAFGYIIIRLIGKHDKPHTTIFYYSTIGFVISSFLAIINWQTPDPRTLIFLLLTGIFVVLYQECLIRAHLFASPRVVAPLTYTSIIFSGVLEFFIWGKIPGSISIMGIILIFASSLIIIKMEKNH